MKTNLLYTTAATLFLVFFLTSALLPTETNVETESVNTEESLEIEEWMISDTYWGVEEKTQEKEVSVKEEKEEPLEVENWMVNEEYWGL
jgi:hypothetical protein